MMGFLESARFLARLPVPAGQATSDGTSSSSMVRSIVHFSLVGALLGVVLALIDWGCAAWCRPGYLLPSYSWPGPASPAGHPGQVG